MWIVIDDIWWTHSDTYRIKKPSRLINGVEVPIGITEEPKIGSKVYFVTPSSEDFASYQYYTGRGDRSSNYRSLKRGFLFDNREDASAVGKALFGNLP